MYKRSSVAGLSKESLSALQCLYLRAGHDKLYSRAGGGRVPKVTDAEYDESVDDLYAAVNKLSMQVDPARGVVLTRPASLSLVRGWARDIDWESEVDVALQLFLSHEAYVWMKSNVIFVPHKRGHWRDMGCHIFEHEDVRSRRLIEQLNELPDEFMTHEFEILLKKLVKPYHDARTLRLIVWHLYNGYPSSIAPLKRLQDLYNTAGAPASRAVNVIDPDLEPMERWVALRSLQSSHVVSDGSETEDTDNGGGAGDDSSGEEASASRPTGPAGQENATKLHEPSKTMKDDQDDDWVHLMEEMLKEKEAEAAEARCRKEFAERVEKAESASQQKTTRTNHDRPATDDTTGSHTSRGDEETHSRKRQRVITPTSPKEAYAFLLLPVNADMNDVKKAYRYFARKYHPDKDPSGSDMFVGADAAYNIIKRSATSHMAYTDYSTQQYRQLFDNVIYSTKGMPASKRILYIAEVMGLCLRKMSASQALVEVSYACRVPEQYVLQMF